MKNLNITACNSTKIYLNWEDSENCNKYVLQGLSNFFSYESIAEFETNDCFINDDILNNYIAFRIAYVEKLNKKDTYVEYSKEVYTKEILKARSNKEKNTVNIIESYEGFSISFVNKDIYDKYVLYEKVDGNYVTLIESEDFQFTSN